jgi:ribulose-phosphate 3-epimerase
MPKGLSQPDGLFAILTGMKIEIIPAILPRDFTEVEEKVSLVKGLVKTVQIDVCDGQFTPEPTWPYRKHDDFFERLVHEEEGLPGWQELDFEIDLMANHPEDKVEQWVTAGATRIIIHAEAKGDIGKAIETLKGRVEIGVAFNIDTPISKIDGIQFIQLMGIDHIGFQGQAFDPKVIEKVTEAQRVYPSCPVSIDGGVSLESAPSLLEAGARRLVVGSAIFEAGDVFGALKAFKSL